MNNVMLNIKGKQKYADSGEWDVTEFATEGIFEPTERGFKISYDESELIGAENVKSVVTVEDGVKADVIRTGPVTTTMTVEKGKRHTCFYSTPQGDFSIGIFGEAVTARLKDLNGEIYMSYTIDVNSSLISENKMLIKIKEIKQ